MDDQIGWYDAKSITAQRTFKQLRAAEIVAAAAIPFLAGLTSTTGIPILIALLGAGVVVLAAFQSLGLYHENWTGYRATSEALKREKYLFLSANAPYDDERAFPRFVERIEGLLARESEAWSRHAREARPDSGDSDGPQA
ncbi:MAG: DUF4231 domain-containing protein [Gemmatimonadetes bacterium]|nr:DUF4231 domain-containing protein [Gemmatimonadota bacterium]